MAFPVNRLRRLRGKFKLREMVAETRVAIEDFVYPLFVRSGKGIKIEIPSMPGNFQWSIDLLVEECKEIYELGIPAVILFGIPEIKDSYASEAFSETGIIQRALRVLKQEVPELLYITDVCLCEYTDHGHCGMIKNNSVDNDATLPVLARTALSHVEAGADIVAPSDMMDGRVKAIREALDNNGYPYIPIMAYSAKYASAFYGPFRDAAGSAPMFGDRKSYQMDPRNAREALREVESDIEEGADIIMVKPALPYLDIISEVHRRYYLPLAAYNVSGEFSMVKAAGRLGWIDEKQVMLELLTSIKRAGADIIISYFAKQYAKLAGEGKL